MANHNIMLRATPLPNVQGRTDYISNPKRQEHLVAVASTISPEKEKKFWRDLAEHCRENAKFSTSKKACEGREYMILLANELAERDPEELAKMISKKFKELTGTENKVAIHWNKDKTSYHCHVVCAENPEINQVKTGAVMTRNTYFDENGKRSTKKNCVDQDGNLKPGCTFIPKGGQKIDQIRFGSKNASMSSKDFLAYLKLEMAIMQNKFLQEERFQVFVDDGIHIPEQRIGKNTTEEQKKEIIKKNKVVRAYNKTVDQTLEASMKDDELNAHTLYEIRQIRKETNKFGGKEAGKKWVEAIHKAKLKIQDLYREIVKAITKDDFKDLISKLRNQNEQASAREYLTASEPTHTPVSEPSEEKEQDTTEPIQEAQNASEQAQNRGLDAMIASASGRAKRREIQRQKQDERCM